MRVKILNSQREIVINKELVRLEKGNRNVDSITPFGKKTFIFHYADDPDLEKQLISFRSDLDKLNSRVKK